MKKREKKKKKVIAIKTGSAQTTKNLAVRMFALYIIPRVKCMVAVPFSSVYILPPDFEFTIVRNILLLIQKVDEIYENIFKYISKIVYIM